MTEREAFALLRAHGQEHLLREYETLAPDARRELLSRIGEIDWETIALRDGTCRRGEFAPIPGLNREEIERRRAEFEAAGIRVLREGKAGAVLLAGGQGTRLGSDAPKGAFDLGITRPVYVFERIVAGLSEAVSKSGVYPPLFVMTSEKNDEETRAFFKAHRFFGYPERAVRFFVQEMAPCVDFSGKLLFEEKGKLALSPNGNGGWFSSLLRAGHLKDFPDLAYLDVFSVDNVLQKILDPAFVGAAVLSGKPCAAKVVAKVSPEEKVGVLCLENGSPAVVEYYELTPEMANARGTDGTLLYRYGVILNYLFRLDALLSIASERIPVHVVKKKVPYFDGTEVRRPETENAYKFETLILDMVHLLGDCLPYEVEREREFAPVKNRTGTDSVDTARELLKKNGVEL